MAVEKKVIGHRMFVSNKYLYSDFPTLRLSHAASSGQFLV